MRILASIAICFAILSGASNVQAGQAPNASSQEASCSITGRVTIENEAAPDIAVALQPASSSWPLPPPVARATTDKEGLFRLTNLAAGRYYLIPFAAAYFAPSEDREVESGKPVTLLKGENLEGIELKLIPGGVITGRVTTASGYPVIGRDVYPIFIDSQFQHLLARSKVAGSKFKTDDRGVYRIYGLPSGRYVVYVRSHSRNLQIETFHPNAAERSQASLIDVMSGKVVENINIKLPPFTNGYDVSGRVIDAATGQPLSKTRVNCLGGNKSGRSHIGSPSVNERGEFSFSNLAPGNYSVFLPMDSLSEYYSDPLDFELVDQDISGLEIKARRAASLSGEIVINGASDPAILSDLSHMGISVSRTGGGGFSVRVQANARGQFRIPGLPPDKYSFYIYSNTGRQSFWLLDVERDGVSQKAGFDVAAGEQVKGFRVIVAYGEGVLHGRVQVVGGTPPEDLRFNVYANRADIPGKPASSSSISVDAQGRFILKGLATGDHEITLTPFIPSPNGNIRSGRWSEMKQTISVKDGTESQITFVFNLNPSNPKERKL